MRALSKCAVWLLLAVTVAPRHSGAAEFEGVLLWRQISIPRARLHDLAPGLEADPEKILGIRTAQLLSLKGSWLEVRESTVEVSGTKVRLERPLPRGQSTYLVMDVAAQTAFLVLAEEGRVVEIRAAETAAIRDRLAAAEKLVEENAGKLGGHKDRRLKNALRHIAGQPKLALHPLGRTQVVNGLKTTGFELRTEDRVIWGWVAQEPRDLLRTFRLVEETRTKLGPFGGEQREASRALAQRGLPVLLQMLGPERYQVEELVQIERRAVPKTNFEIPAGLERTSLEELAKEMLHSPAEKGPVAGP